MVQCQPTQLLDLQFGLTRVKLNHAFKTCPTVLSSESPFHTPSLVAHIQVQVHVHVGIM